MLSIYITQYKIINEDIKNTFFLCVVNLGAFFINKQMTFSNALFVQNIICYLLLGKLDEIKYKMVVR